MPFSIVKFFYAVLGLTSEKKIIQDVGLGGLIHIKKIQMQGPVLECIIKNYDPKEDMFKAALGDTFTVNPYDVHVVMGLEDKGTIVKLDQNIAVQDIAVVYKENIHKHDGFSIFELSLHLMCNNIHKDVWIKSFVLYALGTILAPVSTNRIPTYYYALFQDIEKMKQINWNALTLGFLTDNLALEPHPIKWPCGNLALLQFCYWEKIRPRESNFFFVGRRPPLMKYWDQETADKRDLYSTTYGWSDGMVIDDLSKQPTFHTDMSTPKSGVLNSCNGCKEVDRKVTRLEKSVRRIMQGKLLEVDFNATVAASDYTSKEPTTEDDQEPTDEDDSSNKTVKAAKKPGKADAFEHFNIG